MGNKDIAEKSLEWLPDIFADIVNAYFAIHGIKRVVQPHELMDTKERKRLRFQWRPQRSRA